MKRFLPLAILAGCMLLPTSLLADENSRKAAAREVLKVMDTEKQLQSSIDIALDAISQTNPDLAENEKIKKSIKKFLTKYMGWNALEDDLVKIYAKVFTEKELVALAAFYRSPAGKRMAAQGPVIFKMTTELANKKVLENQAELVKMMSE